jgi:epoxyqueuosine reductase
MSKYHSTISRRDFMKALGLGGIGIGASTAFGSAIGSSGATIFRDLDEAKASPQASFKRPSWVKEVNKPTIEIDWQNMSRFNGADVMWEKGYVKAVGQEVANTIIALAPQNRIKWIKENKPGFTMRDFAFNQARLFMKSGYTDTRTCQTFLGPQTASTPESLGLPRYEGTPEENARMIRTFLRAHGCSEVSFVELDTNTTEKILYATDAAGVPYNIRDVEQPIETEKERVIPKKARWVIVYAIRMGDELLKRAPTYLSYRPAFVAYEYQCLVQSWLQNFLRALGYMGLGWHRITSSLGSTTGFGVMAGLGEMGRTMHLITPEHGQTERIFHAITDLPLAPGKPIDFGATQFCRTCKKCSQLCPSRSLSNDTEPSWEPDGFYHRSGVRAWYRYEPGCRSWMYVVDNSCSVCIAVCPFSKLYKAPYHDIVRTISSNTPIFNGALKKMDDIIGYGKRPEDELENFWDMDLPPFGWA